MNRVARRRQLIDALGTEAADAVVQALHSWIPMQAQFVLDEANATITSDPDWMKADELAGQAEQLAHVARVLADMTHELHLRSKTP